MNGADPANNGLLFAGVLFPGQDGRYWAAKNAAEWFMKKPIQNPPTIPGPPEKPDLGGRDEEAIEGLEKAAHALMLLMERGEIMFDTLFVVAPAQELCEFQNNCRSAASQF